MRRLPRQLVALVALTAIGPAAAPAQAQDRPFPGCGGMSFVDAREDAIHDTFGLGGGAAARPNMDILGGWLRYDGATLNAYLQVANLDRSVPAGASATVWTFNWHAGQQRFYVSATSDGTNVSFAYGLYDAASAIRRDDRRVAVKGTLYEGADGVVQLEIPARHAQPGVELQRVFGETLHVLRAGEAGTETVADRAPDAQDGPAYLVGGCVDGAGAAPAQAPAAAPPRTRATKTLPELPFRSVVQIGSAKKANSRRSLGFKVRGGVPISSLKARLSDSRGRVVAAGGMRRLSGVKALKLTLRRGARLRRGTYVLRAEGTVRGKRRWRTLRVSVRA